MKNKILLFVLLIANIAWGQTETIWTKLTNHTDVTEEGTYMIVDVNSNYALTSAGGTENAPPVVEINIIDGNTIIGEISENLQWTFEISGSGYIIRPIHDQSVALNSTNSNNGVRVNNGNNNVWELSYIHQDYKGFFNTKTNSHRYLGVYNNQDWRTYYPVHENIKNTQIEIFQLEETPSTDPLLIPSVSELSGFIYGLNNGPSDAQTFVLSGNNFDGTQDATLLVDSGFELSLDGIAYSDELTIENYDGASTDIYVRMSAGLGLGEYTGSILIDAYEQDVLIDLSGNVLSPPIIDDSEDLEAQVGVEYQYQIIATENPISYFISSEELPEGLTLDDETGLISGTPTTAGEFLFGVTATNSVGDSNEAAFIMNISKGIQTVDLGDIIVNLGDADMTLPSTTDQGFELYYEMNPTSVVSLDGNVLSFLEVGTVDFMAYTLDEDANYEDYLEVFTITVNEEVIVTECFSVDFADIENGHSDGTSGSSSQWNGNDDFPVVERAYQAGGAVRLGTGSATGFIESRDLTEVEGDISVNIVVKGWTTVEGDLIVSIDGQSETLSYTAVMADDFEMITASFEGVTAGSNLKLETTSRRVFIDNVEILCEEPEPVFTWNGSEDSDWNNAANWTPNEVPTADDFAIIAGNATHYPIIAEDEIAINKLKVDANAEIEIASGNLIVADAIDVDESATFVIKDGGNLLQNNEEVSNIGKIIVEINFTFSAERNQFNFVISPVKDQNIKNLFETNDYLAQKYDETTNYFEFFDGQYLGAGIGQAIEENKEGDEIQTAVFVGEPHNGTINVTDLSNENTRFHLAGNPYPSQLDLVKFYTDNEDNIESTFLFWDNRGNEVIYQQGDDYQGSNYAVFNVESGPVGTGTAAPAFGETDGKIPTQKVAVGNAFMLRLISGKDSYEFNNNQRVNGKGENFLGNDPTPDVQNRNAQSTEGVVNKKIINN